MNELKPCPFCGGKARFYTGVTLSRPEHATVFCKCQECYVSTRVYVDSQDDGSFFTLAQEEWNRRVK